MTLPPKLELHCPPLSVANKSLEITLVSWGALSLDVDWKIEKDGVQVAKGKILQHIKSEQLLTLNWSRVSASLLLAATVGPTSLEDKC